MKNYIHMRDDWPVFRWDMASLAGMLAEKRNAQGRLLGRMEGLGFELQTEADLTVMTAEVVKSSAIEGEHLNNKEVRSSLARRLGIDIGGAVKVSRAVDGIVEMMLDATRNYKKRLDKERLFAWHAALFPTGRSGMRKITVGAWRTPEAGPMQVVSGALGREKVHYEAPAAGRLAKEMSLFLKWFNAESKEDPIIKAALAHFWFITIHPFEDGNGRIARAIADMALARADDSARRFYSMSAQIEAERKAYYAELERSQKGTMDITDWMTWFIACLGRSIDRAEETLTNVLRKAAVWRKISISGVNERQRAVINRLLDDYKGNLTSSKYAKMAHCSPDTALRDIHSLIAQGLLCKNPGRGRSASYRLN